MEKKETAKERILQVASNLFYDEGIRAVGIDRIIEESGVAKASFYRNFATKDALVVAFLEQRHARSMERIETARSRYPGEPYKQLLEVLRLLSERMIEPDFRGCPFMNTTIEFPEQEHPGHHKAKECRIVAWHAIKDMAEEAGASDPEALAKQLEIAYSGAVMTAYLYRSKDNGKHFYHVVQLLLKEHFPDHAKNPAVLN
ncbi:TetR/AcrR family transcriptional regulator [Paenibacillus sp. GD4]|jgi:AcrR family transcriptional regulator|uniref:TetR/AcrR family transcriptional regulator n=1 Tax=Paenibacillus TaxID=44249 RepID=UPI002542E745|nr:MULTISPECIES: TetR/AcrR family transcriptional regulator [Paenibacillus]MDQ1912262.1 TetR/AcrR family transcriptional regulator [Paenibacillus sp. GD4]